eukprot:4086900-Amphidinium_carterae.1
MQQHKLLGILFRVYGTFVNMAPCYRASSSSLYKTDLWTALLALASSCIPKGSVSSNKRNGLAYRFLYETEEL